MDAASDQRVNPDAVGRVAEQVRGLAAGYEPPSFAHVPDPDAAIFLCAIDHRTGYRGRYLVDGRGPVRRQRPVVGGGLQAAGRHPRTADRWCAARRQRRARRRSCFGSGARRSPTPSAARRCGATWPTGSSATTTERPRPCSAARRAAGGDDGLLSLLGGYQAYADPLGKKSFLFAKICERRGWLRSRDPECWEVCADNVLMRLALRSGLVHPGALEEVRASDARGVRSESPNEAGIDPPALDDLLWELGRDIPDLLGTEGGDLSEPRRDPDSTWY